MKMELSNYKTLELIESKDGEVCLIVRWPDGTKGEKAVRMPLSLMERKALKAAL